MRSARKQTENSPTNSLTHETASPRKSAVNRTDIHLCKLQRPVRRRSMVECSCKACCCALFSVTHCCQSRLCSSKPPSNGASCLVTTSQKMVELFCGRNRAAVATSEKACLHRSCNDSCKTPPTDCSDAGSGKRRGRQVKPLGANGCLVAKDLMSRKRWPARLTTS